MQSARTHHVPPFFRRLNSFKLSDAIVPVPKAFVEALGRNFPGAVVSDELFNSPPAVGIRINKAKPSNSFSNLTAVPWCAEAFTINHRPHFAHDPFWHAGHYYVQEPSSTALSALLRALGLTDAPVLALDACAAPGGKTTLLLDNLQPNSMVVANEVNGLRNSILRENLVKWGALNHAVTQLPLSQLAQNCPGTFDVVLLDAPCSGEGMMRKDQEARRQWSHNLVLKCAALQAELIESAAATVNENGYLIYSTCTLNPTENECHAPQMEALGFEPATPVMPELDKHVIYRKLSGTIVGFYFLPGLGEGLFVSCWRRTSSVKKGRVRPLKLPLFRTEFSSLFAPLPAAAQEWHAAEIAHAVHADQRLSMPSIPYKMVGQPVLNENKGLRTPHHGSAMLASARPAINLDSNNALSYLRKGGISAPRNAPLGWLVVGFEGAALGWVKNLGQRCNNYYPAEWKIRT